jgi:hypothetical protein
MTNLPPQYTLREDALPHKKDIWYCYDAPVLVVAITWWKTPVGFGRLLHHQLALNYFGDEQLVGAPCLWSRCLVLITHRYFD